MYTYTQTHSHTTPQDVNELCFSYWLTPWRHNDSKINAVSMLSYLPSMQRVTVSKYWWFHQGLLELTLLNRELSSLDADLPNPGLLELKGRKPSFPKALEPWYWQGLSRCSGLATTASDCKILSCEKKWVRHWMEFTPWDSLLVDRDLVSSRLSPSLPHRVQLSSERVGVGFEEADVLR